ncbi:thiamine-phosphate kinase [Parahaliea sp. F7430]|uniref:Thiamine-monophosphate kinase n=1 Tax=Sediminihaliea albiluteola TaxID=2758564 RepID=A0A7W2TTA3_9GAMM|nr:thiamine-phosphate kinase [Sediminihaliea albiluteola]MBA6411555.1 thiamine-phosphate kinase [Sediminihaliea albiluteola]
MAAGEFDLIYRYFSSLGRGPAVDLSVGDDCAILKLQPGERLATSIDTLVEAVHFPAEAFPEDLGFRAVAVAASDLAAMGAKPVAMTLALSLPEPDELWLHTFSEGLAAAVKAFDLPLVGGDTTKGPLTITVQVMGALPADKALLRSAAQVGDMLCVSGPLGDGAAGLSVVQGEWEGRWQGGAQFADYLEQRYYRPSPRLALGQQLLGSATAAIDISDGLLADAGHIAAASGVKLVIEPELIPLSAALAALKDREQALRWALSGGDDYELCFCLPSGSPVPKGCTRIGQVVAGEGVECNSSVISQAGYQHF